MLALIRQGQAQLYPGVPEVLDSLQGRVTAAEVLGKLAFLAGFNPSAEPKTAEQLLADFDWVKVPREDIRLPEGLF